MIPKTHMWWLTTSNPASGHWAPACTCLNIRADTHRHTNTTETLAKEYLTLLELSFLSCFLFLVWVLSVAVTAALLVVLSDNP